MEDCLAGNAPRCQDISSIGGSSTDINISAYNSPECLSMNDLEICLTTSAEDIEMPISSFSLFPGDNSIGNVVTPQKCFTNSYTFPVLDEPKSSVDGLVGGEKGQRKCKTSKVDESAESVDKGNARYVLMTSDTIPSPKLVSAMKGSRGKQGIEPKKLSVMWAPDVYDPTPTSLSHVPSSRNQQYHNAGKKYRKNKKHKAGDKSSQGNKGKKGKKQARKNGIEG